MALGLGELAEQGMTLAFGGELLSGLLAGGGCGAALLFELEVTSDDPVRWQPERTRLELNREGNVSGDEPGNVLEDIRELVN